MRRFLLAPLALLSAAAFAADKKPVNMQELNALLNEAEKTPQKKEEWIDPIAVTEKRIKPNKLGVTKDDILVQKNENGEGFFTYVKRTEFAGVKRNFLWFVRGDNIYRLTGASEAVAPGVKPITEAPDEILKGAGFDRLGATETGIRQVFGQYPPP